jgi:putative transcriptional regulator
MITHFNDVRTGKLLIAEPFMLDPNFRRSVVLLTDHKAEEGSLGFIINKKLDLRLNDLLPDFPEFNAALYGGGPVESNSIHILHNIGDLLEGSTRISSGVYWGGDWEHLKFLIEAKLVEPKHIRFFLGYSSWEENQLKEEVDTDSWILSDMHANYLFNLQPHTLWRTVLQHKGNSFAIIGDMPDHNQVN